MKCPVCGAVYHAGTSPQCRRCGLDLSPLIDLADGAIACHREAIMAFESRNYGLARKLNHRALALHQSNGDFHCLAGQLLFLEGKFAQAILCWHRAQALGSVWAVEALELWQKLRTLPQ